MKPEFWQERWDNRQIGFHSDAVHHDLLHLADEWLADGPHHVLVPLCGKSVDLAWLAARGHRVTGIELVRTAVEELFAEAGLTPEWRDIPGGACATAGPVCVLQGDLFALDLTAAGPFTRVWDRAAMVALHPDQRERYVTTLRRCLAPGGSLLLNALNYDASVMDGPPWSLDAETVQAHYPEATRLHRRDVLDERWRSRGHDRFHADTWLVRP